MQEIRRSTALESYICFTIVQLSLSLKRYSNLYRGSYPEAYYTERVVDDFQYLHGLSLRKAWMHLVKSARLRQQPLSSNTSTGLL